MSGGKAAQLAARLDRFARIAGAVDHRGSPPVLVALERPNESVAE